MRSRRGKAFSEEDDGFAVESQDAFIGIYKNAASGIYFATFRVAVISLVVGGIGVMDIMLCTVTKRTKKIDIRKALGATEFSIFSQFLIEAVILTAIGGVIGLVIGEGMSYLTITFSPLPAYIPIWAVALGLIILAGIGIIFGLYPAWKASTLDPIEALRWE